MVSIVVAHNRKRVIGRDGQLPWHLPTDLRRFKELTAGHTVVMGRKTFDSLPPRFRPLPDRRNLVLSNSLQGEYGGAEICSSLPQALDACGGECFVIGGEVAYGLALPLADRVYATEIDSDDEGDAFFPQLPAGEWTCVEESEPFVEDSRTFTFKTYERAGKTAV